MKFLSKLFLVVLVFAGMTFAQTTYYVDVQNGLDGYNGLSATVTGVPGVGPKQTINNAIAAASHGDIISVAYANGNLYNEAVLVNNKTLTFTTTGGTPNVYSFQILNVKATMDALVPAQPDDVTFTGPIKFTTKLDLDDGDIIGAGNITVATLVERTLGTVDAQLLYSGVVNFLYSGGVATTTGFELPASDNTTNFGNLSVTGATPLTLNGSKVMNGILNTSEAIDLGTFTLGIVGTNAHVLTAAKHITNGTLAFTLTGAASINAVAANLPNLTVTSTGANTLTVNSTGTLGNVTNNGKSIVALVGPTPTVGNITNNSTGGVTVTAATGVGSVTNTNSAAVTLTAATTSKTLTNTSSGTIVTGAVAGLAITGGIAQSGTGSVNLGNVAGAITVSTTVTNNPTLDVEIADLLAANNYGVIIFPNQAITITGKLTVAPVFTGTTTAVRSHANIGEVRFASTIAAAHVTINGGVEVNASYTAITVTSTKTLTLTNCGSALFSNTTANILIPGGITVNTNIPALTNATFTEVGSFIATARTTGTFGALATRTGAIANNSIAGTEGLNGNIKVAATTNAGFWGTSVTATGGKGGFIVLGNENLNLSGSVLNQKTTAANHIDFGTANTNTVAVQIGGNVDNQGASNIRFMAFNGEDIGGDGTVTPDPNFAVTGILKSSGTGTIKINDASLLAGTGTFSFGGVDITDGTIDLQGFAGSIMDVVVNGPANFVGGTVDVGNTVALTLAPAALAVTPVVIPAADRLLQLGGLFNTFSSATGSTDFSANANVILLIQPTAVVAAQTLTGNSTATVWPGQMVVKNPTGLQPAVTFTGGNFRVLDHVAFDLSLVKIDGVYIFVGGLLAPNIGSGNFYNHPGYLTVNHGFISMNGNAAATVAGAGTFENFEVDMAAGATVGGTFNSTFNLTNGAVAGGAAIIFNNATNYPTIVRNAGTFTVAPTFTTMVNLYYIGLDKAAALEVPAFTDKLNDLTVATTNDGTAPLIPGQGTVTIGATTVNGTLNIYPLQTLKITGDLTMNGASIILDGDIVNDVATSQLVFNRVAGTTITGAGWLPDILIADGSVGNVIDGAQGLVTDFLAANNSRDAADFDPTAAVANGTIVYNNTGAGGLKVVFDDGALNGTHLGTITTAHASSALEIAADLVSSGAINHVKGAITIDDTFTWSALGTAFNMTTGALINGPGTLSFETAATIITTTPVATVDPTIAAPVVVNMPALANTLTLATGAGTGNLILSGDFTVTKGTVVLGGVAAAPNDGRNLTLTGKNFTMTANSAFAAHNGAGAYILGTLVLNAATANAPMIWSHTGTPTLANVTIANDVTLAGTGLGLTIYRTFTHTAGKLDFSTRDITIDNQTTPIDGGVLAAAGTYRNVAGTYAATDGYLIINTTTFNQGANAFTIPNLRFSANAVAGIASQTGVVTVLSALDLAQPGVVDIKNANTGNNVVLAVDSGAVVTHMGVTATAFDIAPTFIGTIELVSANPTAGATVVVCDATIWPATPANLVRTLTMDNTNAGSSFELPGNRNVGDLLDLQVGILDLGTAANRTLTVTNSTVRRRQGGSVVLAGGTLTYTHAPDVFYEPSVAGNATTFAGAGDFYTGPELPATVNNLTFSRITAGNNNVANATVTLISPVTVNGDLTIRNDVRTSPVTIPAAVATASPITLLGNLVIGLDANALATAPVTLFPSALIFAGPTADQTITVPAGGASFGSITINKAIGNVSLVGGNLDLATQAGTMTFIKGLFLTGDKVLVLNKPVGAPGSAVQGFVHTPANGFVSHVFGNVAINPAMNPSPAFARTEWPVGSMTEFRPVALTILNTFNAALGVNITVKHVPAKPAGIVGLPITHGGDFIARYPDFYWSITSATSLSQLQFDLELTATGFTQYGNILETVLLRRNGANTDTENTWFLQGEDYDNYVAGGIPTVINRNSRGGLRAEGAIFTYGMPTRLYTTGTLPDRTIGVEDVTIDIAGLFGGNEGDLTYHVSSTNNTVLEVPADDFTETTFDITGLADGQATVTVRATDINGDFFTTSFNVVVDQTVDLEVVEEIPTEFSLAQNFPNPFNPTTKIRFGLPEQSNVTLRIYNILGEEVATLVSEMLPAGFHTLNFDASRLTSGLYVYRIEAGNFVQVKKMMLMK